MADKTENGDSKNTLFVLCGKSQHEVKKLIAGPTVFICDECVELQADITGKNINSLSKSADGCRPHVNLTFSMNM